METAVRKSIWLFPFAFSLHVFEEYPRFTFWVDRYINPHFTQQHYLIIHLSGIIGGLILALILSRWTKQWLLFLALSFFILPAMIFNIVFSSGRNDFLSLIFAGLITALTLIHS